MNDISQMTEREFRTFSFKLLLVLGIYNIIKYLDYDFPIRCNDIGKTNFKLSLDSDSESEFFKIIQYDYGEDNETDVDLENISTDILQAIYSKLYVKAYEKYRQQLNIDKLTKKGLEDLGIWQHLIKH